MALIPNQDASGNLNAGLPAAVDDVSRKLFDAFSGADYHVISPGDEALRVFAVPVGVGVDVFDDIGDLDLGGHGLLLVDCRSRSSLP